MLMVVSVMKLRFLVLDSPLLDVELVPGEPLMSLRRPVLFRELVWVKSTSLLLEGLGSLVEGVVDFSRWRRSSKEATSSSSSSGNEGLRERFSRSLVGLLAGLCSRMRVGLPGPMLM